MFSSRLRKPLRAARENGYDSTPWGYGVLREKLWCPEEEIQMFDVHAVVSAIGLRMLK